MLYDESYNKFNKLCWRPPQYASAQVCKLKISSHLFARWHLFWHVGYLRHQQQVDHWPFDLESGVRVTCDVGYLFANFSLPRLLCFRVRPDVCDRRQTDRRQTKASLNASTLWHKNTHIWPQKDKTHTFNHLSRLILQQGNITYSNSALTTNILKWTLLDNCEAAVFQGVL